jgi:hypothetical protein
VVGADLPRLLRRTISTSRMRQGRTTGWMPHTRAATDGHPAAPPANTGNHAAPPATTGHHAAPPATDGHHAAPPANAAVLGLTSVPASLLVVPGGTRAMRHRVPVSAAEG